MDREVTVKVAAVMTAPRYGNNYARNQIERALHSVNVPLTVSGGVYYGQCMQLMLDEIVKHGGVDYAITVDFDSLFTAKDVRRLIRWMIERPDIHAITGLQVRRGKPSLLGTVDHGNLVNEGEREILWDGLPIRATTAHFGLTVINLEKLAGVEKPWFVSTPDANGDWSEQKTDDDVHFWLQWGKAGNSVYLDPGVRLGHLEEMVAIHDENMNPIHIYPREWEELNDCRNNTPVEALPSR